ncbi:hypothetical protein QN277_013340 [Acacia crassicarpa]|uniref:Uncharacterized protein n=1 Tax=Acacia crassicarpa TaxID=499986 RepID=A0AAE1N3T3_9FABA|nr:hypothetical protein QN277_013340 [Acacia crassicarpa]
MPEPRNQPSNQTVNMNNSFKRMKQQKQNPIPTRKLRIICDDPYATDSSSSEDEGGNQRSDTRRSRKMKRIVGEITLPLAPAISKSQITSYALCLDAGFHPSDSPPEELRSLLCEDGDGIGRLRF